jgi:hypothetical protein
MARDVLTIGVLNELADKVKVKKLAPELMSELQEAFDKADADTTPTQMEIAFVAERLIKAGWTKR